MKTKTLFHALPLFAVACSAAPTTSTPASTDPSTETPSAQNTLLWEEPISADHTVDFYASGSGGWAVLEKGMTGTQRLITSDMAKGGLTGIYATLKPGAALPKVLADAEARASATRTERPRDGLSEPQAVSAGTTMSGAAPKPTEIHPDAIHPDTTGEAQSFMQQHCTTWRPIDCVAGWDYTWTGTTPGWDESTWTSFGGLGSEATAGAPYAVEGYVCYQQWYGGYSCGWQTLATTNLVPGQWAGWTGNTNTVYSQYNVTINGVFSEFNNGTWIGGHTYGTVDVTLQYVYWGTEPGVSGGCDGDGCTWAF